VKDTASILETVPTLEGEGEGEESSEN